MDTLPTEIVCEVVKLLPFEDARNFLSCSSSIREPGKHAFDRNCFRVLPVGFDYDGLLKAEELLGMELARFVQEIFIGMGMQDFNDRDSSTYEKCLGITLRRALKASTKIDTITIHYDPEFLDIGIIPRCNNTNALAKTLYTTLKYQRTPELRIQIKNIRPHHYYRLTRLGGYFLHQIYSLIVRIQYDIRLDDFRSFASLTNLIELSLTYIGDRPIYCALGTIISEANKKPLESITIAGGSFPGTGLSEILGPLKASLKKLHLQRIYFAPKSFETFIRYLSENFSSDSFSLSLEDIWEIDLYGIPRDWEIFELLPHPNHYWVAFKILDPMSYWTNPRPVSAKKRYLMSSTERYVMSSTDVI